MIVYHQMSDVDDSSVVDKGGLTLLPNVTSDESLLRENQVSEEQKGGIVSPNVDNSKVADRDDIRSPSNVRNDESLLREYLNSEDEKGGSVSLNVVEKKVSSVKTESENQLQQTGSTMSKVIEPPTFVSDNKSYVEYKQDLLRWSRLCGLREELQAEMVVYRLEDHPSRIKEKIDTQIGNSLIDNKDGIKDLISFLDDIYTKDDMADAWDKFCEFSHFMKKSDQTMSDFIAEWENSYHKMKKVECVYSDLILAFKLLQASKLNEIETKLVLTGVNYAEGKRDKNLLQQVKTSLKKFKGRPVVMDDKRAVQPSDSLVSEMEDVFISKGWKPPNKEHRRSRSVSPQRTNNKSKIPRSVSPNRLHKQSNYKGRKNALGEDRKPRKCFKCQCNHTESCNCPCVYHFADKCPGRKKRRVSYQKISKQNHS